jgi:hypothetical protein
MHGHASAKTRLLTSCNADIALSFGWALLARRRIPCNACGSEIANPKSAQVGIAAPPLQTLRCRAIAPIRIDTRRLDRSAFRLAVVLIDTPPNERDREQDKHPGPDEDLLIGYHQKSSESEARNFALTFRRTLDAHALTRSTMV